MLNLIAITLVLSATLLSGSTQAQRALSLLETQVYLCNADVNAAAVTQDSSIIETTYDITTTKTSLAELGPGTTQSSNRQACAVQLVFKKEIEFKDVPPAIESIKAAGIARLDTQQI